MPTNRIAKGVEATERYKAGLYDALAALRFANDPDAEQIAKRVEARRKEELEAGLLSKTK